MTYRVVLTPNARQELYEDALWWAEHRDAGQATLWLDGFEKALESLAIQPGKHPPARESQDVSVDLRQMLYGVNKAPTHRAVFEIRGEDVIVHGIRHLARRDLTPDELSG